MVDIYGVIDGGYLWCDCIVHCNIHDITSNLLMTLCNGDNSFLSILKHREFSINKLVTEIQPYVL